jgi:hypothetical protein
LEEQEKVEAKVLTKSHSGDKNIIINDVSVSFLI